MEIVHALPPNYEKIAAAFKLELSGKSAVFTYGYKLYNPSGLELPEHLLVHENVHAVQQKGTAEGAEEWWDKFIADPAFRVEQELEAYGAQYAYAKQMFTPKNATLLLNSIASDLSSAAYGNVLSYGQAASKIRSVAQKLLNP